MEYQVVNNSIRFLQFPLRGMKWIYSSSPTKLQNVMQKLRPLRGIALVFSFLLSFGIPVFLGYHAIRFFTVVQDDSTQANEALPGAVRFSAQGMYGKISNDVRLTPNSTLPYIFSGWFKLTQLPAMGQRIILAARFNPNSAVNEGMAIGVTRDAVGYRPVVYWRAANGSGGWYLFSKFSIRARTWFQLALSFREGKLLGLHGVADIDDLATGVELLGGYELLAETYPTSSMDLVFGAYGQNPFRGYVGPIAIFSGEGVGRDIHGVVKRLMRAPDRLPDLIPESSVIVRGYLGENLESPVGIRSQVIKPEKRIIKAKLESDPNGADSAPTKSKK